MVHRRLISTHWPSPIQINAGSVEWFDCAGENFVYRFRPSINTTYISSTCNWWIVSGILRSLLHSNKVCAYECSYGVVQIRLFAPALFDRHVLLIIITDHTFVPLLCQDNECVTLCIVVNFSGAKLSTTTHFSYLPALGRMTHFCLSDLTRCLVLPGLEYRKTQIHKHSTKRRREKNCCGNQNTTYLEITTESASEKPYANDAKNLGCRKRCYSHTY